MRAWRPHDGPEVTGARFNHRHERPGSGQGIAVGLSVTQPVESATRAYIASNLLCVGDLLLFDLAGGPGQTTVMGGGHAAALAEQVSNTLREIKALAWSCAPRLRLAYPTMSTSSPVRPGQSHPDLSLCLFNREFCFLRLNLLWQ